MRNDFYRFIFRILFLSIIYSINHTFAQTAEINGKVVDGTDNSPLWGANIIIEGTSNGTVTNMDGKFRIVNIHEGNVTVLFRYIGYKTEIVKFKAVSGAVKTINVVMKPEAIKVDKEVVVTAQRQGQQAAINQQLNSNTIVNVVSKDKIQQLPDQNAAETLARLPGISLERSGGEGQKIVIRGLAPKYANITVNGQKIPSTDVDDRSVDLSSISPDMLAGIEVYKSLTADKDADAVGGTVNFTVKKAPDNFQGNFKIQKGYSSQQNYYGNYKGTLDLSDRFFNNKLGLIGTANIQKADRSSDAQDVSYSYGSHGAIKDNLDVGNLNLVDVQELRNRYGASLAADYDLGSGTLLANGFWSRTDQDEQRRRKRFQIANGRTQYEFRQGIGTTQLLLGSVNGNYNLGIFQIDGNIAYSESDQNTPREINDIFQELSSLKKDIILNQGPQYIPMGVKDSLNQTFFKEADINNYHLLDLTKTAELNVKTNFDFGNDIAGFLKFGGKYRSNGRNRTQNQYWTSSFNINEVGMEQSQGSSFYKQFQLTTSGNKLKMSNFLSSNDQVGKFLNGDYNFGPSLDYNLLNSFTNNMQNVILANGDSLFIYNPEIAIQNYNANEQITAGYIMAQVSLTQKILFVPGVRYERTYSDYKSITGTPSADEDVPGIANVRDTANARTYEDIMPMVQLKYQVTGWFDIRAAVTRTLSRPDYFNLVPWQNINKQSQLINKGNPELKHTRVWNYDLYLSMYNEYGLFTIGGFYKKLWDIDYISSSRVQGGVYNGYTITQPVNAQKPSEVYGIEIDLQSNLALLPSPFDGIVFGANLSLMKSQTFYPLLQFTSVIIPDPPYILTTVINTERSGSMPGQANYIGNLAVGYEKGGFTGRLSVVFQGKYLAVIGQSEEYDAYTNSSARWDLTMQQKVYKNVAIYINVNNLTNIPDASFLGEERFPTTMEYYGWTTDLGIKYNF